MYAEHMLIWAQWFATVRRHGYRIAVSQCIMSIVVPGMSIYIALITMI